MSDFLPDFPEKLSFYSLTVKDVGSWYSLLLHNLQEDSMTCTARLLLSLPVGERGSPGSGCCYLSSQTHSLPTRHLAGAIPQLP